VYKLYGLALQYNVLVSNQSVDRINYKIVACRPKFTNCLWIPCIILTVRDKNYNTEDITSSFTPPHANKAQAINRI
jgi:hypothetical protein